MARALSPEKRQLILFSAVHAIAQKGLSASTAMIAKGAGIAEGTMFTYFASKEVLYNELYLALKTEAFRRVQTDFPRNAPLRVRVHHVWIEYLRWAMEKPEERNVAMLLQLSPHISKESRTRVNAEMVLVSKTMSELGRHGAFKSLPASFAANVMKAMQEAVIETPAKGSSERENLFEEAFGAFWKMAE